MKITLPVVLKVAIALLLPLSTVIAPVVEVIKPPVVDVSDRSPFILLPESRSILPLAIIFAVSVFKSTLPPNELFAAIVDWSNATEVVEAPPKNES